MGVWGGGSRCPSYGADRLKGVHLMELKGRRADRLVWVSILCRERRLKGVHFGVTG